MFRSLAKLASTLAASLVFVGVAFAVVSVPLKQKATGTLSTVVPGHLTYAGQGQASHFGNYTITGSADFDNFGNIQNGEDTLTTADGATIRAAYSGTYAPQPSGQVRFDVTATWHSGTGRLAGTTGQSDVVAFVDGVFPGAAFSYEALGNLVQP